MNSIILQLYDHLRENPLTLDEQKKLGIENLLWALSNEDVQEVIWWTEYDKAKAEVLVRFVDEDKRKLQWYFSEFEQAQGNKDDLKGVLDKIFTHTWDVRKRWDIDEVDFNTIKKQLCIIVVYFDLPSKTCWTEVVVDIEEWTWNDSSWDTTWKKSVMKTVLKIFLRIVIALVLIFWTLIVIFAIKAKKQKWESEVEE